MSSVLSKENWKLFSLKIQNFWEDYRRNRIGLLGLGTILIYVALAFLGPSLTPYQPLRDTRLAQAYAMPEWVTILPQYSGYPRTNKIPLYWNVSEKSDLINVQWGEQTTINYLGGNTRTADIDLTSTFVHAYDVNPNVFHLVTNVAAPEVRNVTGSVEISMVALNGTEQLLWWTDFNSPISERPFVNSEGIETMTSLGLDPVKDHLANRIFSGRGEYALKVHVTFMPATRDAFCEINISEGELRVLGLVHGFLGTDNGGRDILSQLLYGVRISLIIGLTAALISTSIGISVGVVSGYIGGAVDEVAMRIVDILLCLPMLPLLLTLMFIYGKSPYYLIVIIALFYWLGLSRIVRSQTLSLREMPFVECAKAAGGGKFYIIFRHLIPNVLPVAFANMVLSVPGAIILEAALSFLGFGDPSTSTWGRMLNQAFNYGAFTKLAWWWIFPPGLAIVILCLAFVFVGHAIDEIANPRLRRRR